MATLGCEPKSTPTGSQIERFLPVIVQTINPMGKDKVSYETLADGLVRIKQWAIFQFKDFRLSAHDTARISKL
ncbi:hypothetical protein F4680DRAFT_445381 [Xylaria scruposa]|nr:hypothetical protein F4680DRAFT_445381 [Xylaria scruposa]